MSLKAWCALWVVLGALAVSGVGLLLRNRERARSVGFDPIAAARTRLEEVRGEGIDLALGPCLGAIGPGWVADVAHAPRQRVDDEPKNQCSDFRTGRANHVVELTPEGKVIRAE